MFVKVAYLKLFCDLVELEIVSSFLVFPQISERGSSPLRRSQRLLKKLKSNYSNKFCRKT